MQNRLQFVTAKCKLLDIQTNVWEHHYRNDISQFFIHRSDIALALLLNNATECWNYCYELEKCGCKRRMVRLFPTYPLHYRIYTELVLKCILFTPCSGISKPYRKYDSAVCTARSILLELHFY